MVEARQHHHGSDRSDAGPVAAEEKEMDVARTLKKETAKLIKEAKGHERLG